MSFTGHSRLAAVAALVAAALVAAAPAQALPTNATIRTYYNNAAHSTEVGEKLVIACGPNGGNTMIWGVTSAYFVTTFEPCTP